MSYLTIKTLHILCACTSGGLFFLRGLLRDSLLLQQRWLKLLPHIIDTLLLSFAVVLMYLSAQYPFVQTWLTVKFLALLVYIVLGTIALKTGRSKRVRFYAWIAGLLVFWYIVMLAMTKQVWIFM